MRLSLFRFLGIVSLTVVVVFCTADKCFSQTSVNSTGTGGRHTIQGSIFLPNGSRPEIPVKVELESTTYTPLSVFADRNGNFAFKSLSPGTYTIVVNAGEDFETAREYISIDPDIVSTRTTVSAKVTSVPVYLQFKTKARLNNEVVNARLAAVPKDALKHFEKAASYCRENKTEKCIEELKMAITIYPEFSIALTELGKQYLKLGKLDEALDSLGSSIKIDANDFEAQLNYGIALLNKRDSANAEKVLKKAITINNSAITPHLYLGIVLIQNRQIDEAQKELELAKKLKGENDLPLVHKYLGGIYWAKKQFKEAADELEKYVELSPKTAETDKIRETIKELRKKQ